MLAADRRERLRRSLLDEREQVQRSLDGLNTDELSTDSEIGIGNHMADDATEVFNQEAQVSLKQNEQHVLEQINLALRRIDQGQYGVCERCGREIDFARLKAQPYSRFCLSCQRLIENEA